MATPIGVYLAEFRRSTARLVGSHACRLSQLAHTPSKPGPQRHALARAIANEFGHTLYLTCQNHQTPEQEAASSGREPGVLIDHGQGHLSMIAD